MIDSEDLLDQCSTIIKANLRMDNCIEIFEIASRMALKDLKEATLRLIFENSTEFNRRMEELDPLAMNQILLEIVNEMVKFKQKQKVH